MRIGFRKGRYRNRVALAGVLPHTARQAADGRRLGAARKRCGNEVPMHGPATGVHVGGAVRQGLDRDVARRRRFGASRGEGGGRSDAPWVAEHSGAPPPSASPAIGCVFVPSAREGHLGDASGWCSGCSHSRTTSRRRAQYGRSSLGSWAVLRHGRGSPARVCFWNLAPGAPAPEARLWRVEPRCTPPSDAPASSGATAGRPRRSSVSGAPASRLARVGTELHSWRDRLGSPTSRARRDPVGPTGDTQVSPVVLLGADRAARWSSDRRRLGASQQGRGLRHSNLRASDGYAARAGARATVPRYRTSGHHSRREPLATGLRTRAVGERWTRRVRCKRALRRSERRARRFPASRQHTVRPAEPWIPTRREPRASALRCGRGRRAMVQEAAMRKHAERAMRRSLAERARSEEHPGVPSESPAPLACRGPQSARTSRGGQRGHGVSHR